MRSAFTKRMKFFEVKHVDTFNASDSRQFHQASHFIGVMLENFRSKGYYKFFGALSWIIAPLSIYAYIYAYGPRGFGALGAVFLAVIISIVLLAIYCLLLLIAIFDFKRIVHKSTNIFIDIGYLVGFIALIYAYVKLK